MIERLQIYKDAYLLTGKIYDAIPQMEKLHRYTIGSKILDSSLDMFKWITMANKARGCERIKALDEFLVNFEQLRVYLKLCTDFKLFKMKTLIEFFKIIDSISRQLSGWRVATTRAQ